MPFSTLASAVVGHTTLIVALLCLAVPVAALFLYRRLSAENRRPRGAVDNMSQGLHMFDSLAEMAV